MTYANDIHVIYNGFSAKLYDASFFSVSYDFE